jgi:hypothetical protein
MAKRANNATEEGAMRVTLDDGQWWELKDYLTHGDQRAIDRVGQASALAMMSSVTEVGVALDKLQGRPSGENGAAPAATMLPEAEDELLLRCTMGWSWPEAVTAETIADRPAGAVKTVLGIAQKEYGFLEPVPETSAAK